MPEMYMVTYKDQEIFHLVTALYSSKEAAFWSIIQWWSPGPEYQIITLAEARLRFPASAGEIDRLLKALEHFKKEAQWRIESNGQLGTPVLTSE